MRHNVTRCFACPSSNVIARPHTSEQRFDYYYYLCYFLLYYAQQHAHSVAFVGVRVLFLFFFSSSLFVIQ
jgi:hypothetical protein